MLVHERLECLQPIQNLLHLHPVRSILHDGVFARRSSSELGTGGANVRVRLRGYGLKPTTVTRKFCGKVYEIFKKY